MISLIFHSKLSGMVQMFYVSQCRRKSLSCERVKLAYLAPMKHVAEKSGLLTALLFPVLYSVLFSSHKLQ